MPLSNPFRRTADRPSLRERAADLKSNLARAIRKPVSGPADEPEATPVSSVEDFAAIEFGAYTFDVPVKAPQEWAEKFAGHALAMHLADRTVRMTKPELVAFIRDAGERSAETPAAMFHALDAGQASLDGWANLLGLARARYIVAGATECAGSSVANEAAEAPGAAPDSFSDHVSQAGSSGDVLASSGIDHRDGTVSYADANGRIVRHPLPQWIAFTAQQMHGRIRNEISRRAIIEASNLSADERAAWEAGVRRELRSDAVHALAFRHLRAFEAAEAFNSGAEPATQGMRERGDAELRSLALAWEAAVDLLQQRNAEEETAVAAAPDKGWPVRAPKGTGPEWDEYLQQKEAWRERHGIIAAENASSDAATALHEIELRIAGLSAASLAGLKLKARVGQRHDDIGLDWPDNLGAGLARDILAFVETAPVGRPDLTKPDTLAAAILDGWKAWGTTPCESEEAWNRSSEQRDRLLYAAMALPATPESIPAKALACAWMEWVNAEHPGQPRDAYGPADQLVYDLHTAMMGRATSAASQTAPSYSYLVDQIDFASATMSELLSLRDIANCIGDVTYAHAWGARCHKGANASGATDHNQVGKLVNSLGDALTAVESAAEQEARRRERSEEAERSTRLYMLAPATIDNGDPDEIEAFARELLAHAEAERTRG